MNTLKAVLKHLNKEENVELSSEEVEFKDLATIKKQTSEKVELSLAKDFDKAVDAVIDQVGNSRNRAQEAKEIVKSAIRLIEMSFGGIRRAQALGSQLEKAIKDLGVPEPNGFRASLDRLKDENAKAKKYENTLNRILKELNL